MKTPVTLETITALCKRRGFVFPSAEIYGGLNGVYDFGPLGVLLKDRIKSLWQKSLMRLPYEIVFLDGALLGHPETWTASGHTQNFSDPMVDCRKCKRRYRSDDNEFDSSRPCSACGNLDWTEPRTFNLMFQTNLGAVSDAGAIAYLRPETAQSIFINFKNVTSSSRVKVPFGIAQIGKAFRNEITPKQFLFRVREFEQMEMEFFVHPEESDKWFNTWLSHRKDFYQALGIANDNLIERAHSDDELAHYSKRCTDIEYKFPFGTKELEGIAHRGSYDLDQHTNRSKKELSYFDQPNNKHFIPHVIETSVGVDRLFLAILCNAYREDSVDGERRVFLSLHPTLAPVKAAVLPLVKKLGETAHKIFVDLKDRFESVQYDEAGSIGKRYRRQDEIGTPFCITIDFETEEAQSVTVRHRDSGSQERIALDQLPHFLDEKLRA